jgi:hypothetical protein
VNVREVLNGIFYVLWTGSSSLDDLHLELNAADTFSRV